MNITRARPRRGAHLVEFALVFPLFLMLFFALVDLGRGLMVVSLLTNAARSGCRAGVVEFAHNSDVEKAVTEKVNGMGLANPSMTITVNGAEQDVSTAQPQDKITVAVSVPYADVTWLPFMRWLTGDLTGHFSLPHE
jgi:Flp pilus assembly protein TadG